MWLKFKKKHHVKGAIAPSIPLWIRHFYYKCKQDAQLSQRDRAAGCVIVFGESRTLELGDNDLRTL